MVISLKEDVKVEFKMKDYQVNKMIDRHIEVYKKHLEQYDISEENEDIAFCNKMISKLKSIQKEVKLFGLIEDSCAPIDSIDLLREVNFDKEFLELSSKLIVEEREL